MGNFESIREKLLSLRLNDYVCVWAGRAFAGRFGVCVAGGWRWGGGPNVIFYARRIGDGRALQEFRARAGVKRLRVTPAKPHSPPIE